jgi:hypothetical protein
MSNELEKVKANLEQFKQKKEASDVRAYTVSLFEEYSDHPNSNCVRKGSLNFTTMQLQAFRDTLLSRPTFPMNKVTPIST